ncbi:hypothetical protein MAR_030418 [Mya arenaria]|uniref:C2H2-type domain-containing protein n=1 Tax=Mya arenaria TaxID=6604 RepID=A0ABY7F354_MYAAR|nr:hypothetical protein MAR_030418 [Mya arenaria]
MSPKHDGTCLNMHVMNPSIHGGYSSDESECDMREDCVNTMIAIFFQAEEADAMSSVSASIRCYNDYPSCKSQDGGTLNNGDLLYSNMADKEERKLSAFQRNSDGKFVCLICDTTLSSKQRTLHHLNLVHDFNSSKPIPKRTLMRKRKLIHEETNKEIGPSPAKLVKDETSVDLFPKENSGNACDENLADLSVQVQGIFDTASKFSMSDIDSDSVCSISSSEVENDSLNDSASADTDSEISDHEHLSTEDRNIQGNEQFSFGLAAYILRYNCSKASSESLISLVKAFNSNSDVTKDLTYNKIFLEVGHSKYKVIHYCQICLNRFPDDVDIFNCSTESCNGLRYIGDVTKQIDPKRKPNAFFIICDVAWQLKLLLERDEELTSVYETGVEVVTNDATMDLQAKAYATSMTMHNGAFVCITCEEQGETVKQGKGYSRCYPYRSPDQRPDVRDSDDIKLVKSPAATSAKRIKGIVGPSAFIAMPWFDMVNGMTPDYMHSVLMEGIHVLLGDSITPGSSGLNVHNIGAHLVYYVRQWGPLFYWSCFGFEDNNAEVLKSVHGTGDSCLNMFAFL